MTTPAPPNLEALTAQYLDQYLKMHAEYVRQYLAGTLGASTPGGLPYPSPTDPVYQGAAAIQALATAIDGILAGSYRIHNNTDTVTVGTGVWSGIGIKALETAGGSDIVASGNGFAVTKAGLYEVHLSIQCGNGNATAVMIGVGVNGATGPLATQRSSTNPGGAGLVILYSGLVRLAVNDTIGAMVNHNASTSLTFTNRRMSLQRVGI
jgi:hypothetical protein